MPFRTVFFFLVSYLIGGVAFAQNTPSAVEGVLDLSNWDWEENGNVGLEGEWDFYWDELYSPGYLSTNDPVPGTFNMPGYWNDVEVNGEEMGAKGVATFVLKVILPPNKGILALKIPPVRSAFVLYDRER